MKTGAMLFGVAAIIAVLGYFGLQAFYSYDKYEARRINVEAQAREIEVLRLQNELRQKQIEVLRNQLADSTSAVPEAATYTLYRDSVTGPTRINVATFASADGEDYNRQNCDIARSTFQAQPGVTVKYWCEKGRYRK